MNKRDMYEQVEPDNTVLRVGPRHTTPVSDDLVLSVRHRTTGDGRSALLTRPAVTGLRDWLNRWLAEGWDGVHRQCGNVYRPDPLHQWTCTEPPEHVQAGQNHEGRATGWPSGSGPTITAWPVTLADRLVGQLAGVSVVMDLKDQAACVNLAIALGLPDPAESLDHIAADHAILRAAHALIDEWETLAGSNVGGHRSRTLVSCAARLRAVLTEVPEMTS
jgi:hypothetical protein